MSTITHYLREQIAEDKGSISFADYIETALYHPQFGFYNQPQFNIGKQGCFVTAPEITPLFAQCFAKELIRLDYEVVLELGAGSGKFAVDFLQALLKQNHLPKKYIILEPSLGLREKQQRLIEAQPLAIRDCVEWCNNMPNNFNGMIIANEVLDALPFHRFVMKDQQCYEYQVQLNKDQDFDWVIKETSGRLQQEIATLQKKFDFADGYESEICLLIDSFIQNIAEQLQEGVVYLIDYGYAEKDYYHPARHQGTLNCIFDGKRTSNPFLSPGQQDITAHVNFTRVANVARENNLSIDGYFTQANFLLAAGLLILAEEAFQSCEEDLRINLTSAIKVLTFPSEMGEVIKVLVLSKNTKPNFNDFEYNRISTLEE